jgi:hypothetical protein
MLGNCFYNKEVVSTYTFQEWKELINKTNKKENKMYRIKTEREFISEFGKNWRDKVETRWNSRGQMDYLCGRELTITSLPVNNICIEKWSISPDCVIEVDNNSFMSKFGRVATPVVVEKPKPKELYFGKVKFTIEKGNDYATTFYGKVTKADIKTAVSYIENPPSLAGYKLGIMFRATNVPFTSGTCGIGFGCEGGTYSELYNILMAFDE